MYPMQPLVVRPSCAADRRELLRMRVALWPTSQEAELDAILALAHPESIVLVAALDEHRLGGFAEFGLRKFADGCTTSPVAYLEGIWVDAELRRSGVASDLVREGEAWARSLGLTELASDSELENHVSQAFHLASGFDEVQRSVCFRRALTRESI